MNDTSSILFCISGEDAVYHWKAMGLLIYFATIMALGVPGNCLILRVYWCKSHKTTTDILITALALADLVVCLLRSYEVAWYSMCLAEQSTNELVFTTLSYVNAVCLGTSVVVTMVIAVDRYDCVCRPNRRMMTTGRTKKVLLALTAFAVAGHLPLYIIDVSIGANALISLTTVLKALQLIVFLIALAIITVCYSKVFLTIKRHVRVAVISRNERLQCQNTTIQASLIDATVSTLVSRQAVLSCSHQPTLSGSTPEPDDNLENRNTEKDKDISAIHKPACAEDSKNMKARSADDCNCPSESVKSRKIDEITRYTRPRPSAQSARYSTRVLGAKRRRTGASVLQRKTTTMLFVTSLVFIMSWLPFLAAAAFSIFAEKSVVAETFVELLYINNVVNPYIYGIANRRFRKECKDVLCILKRIRRQ